ncbi:HK97 gp10 family phage protein [Mycobacterium sp. PSTR-4-N]|uniref:HK97 gp10 family phage protein n=1 Tax=Mycobacterium sp. PSTR-4-N TaxID=2917745 RepID=UPI001F14DD23|nr:HK97 gp10 family phage protein [Mycobacterium sp. PSTR-4-N]MCG7596357.1 hypothetical protein [Mycobacterium sp. PSTR-4-N]
MAELTDLIEQADIDDALENDDEVIAYKVAVARQGVEYARAKAPVDEGDYRDGIRVGREGNSGVMIEFSDWKSHFIEFGTENQEPNPVRAQTEDYLRAREDQ